LKPTGLPPDNSRNLGDEVHQLDRRGNALWRDGETQSSPIRMPRVSAISWVTLCLGRIPPWPGLAPLAHLDFNHAYLRVLGLHREAFRIEMAVAGAAAEVAAAQFPGQVAAVFAVIGADAAFAGVVGEVTQLGALVERADRVGAQRAEAHGRDIEYRASTAACMRRRPSRETSSGQSTARGAWSG